MEMKKVGAKRKRFQVENDGNEKHKKEKIKWK